MTRLYLVILLLVVLLLALAVASVAAAPDPDMPHRVYIAQMTVGRCHYSVPEKWGHPEVCGWVTW